MGVVDQYIGYHLPTVINLVSIQVVGSGVGGGHVGGGGGDCAGGCGDPNRITSFLWVVFLEVLLVTWPSGTSLLWVLVM